MTVKIGIAGTSWWADAMYMPALENHPQAQVVAVCGRNRTRARAFAGRWDVPQSYNDYEAMIGSGELDALIVATRNDSHYPITMAAIEAGLHVLCEKPLALTYAQAAEMASLAQSKRVKHMVPFTYRYMPTARFIKELIDDGYIGRPYHLNMRYYTGFGRTPEYQWRFDISKAGSGALGDIGSHFLYLAYWYYGDIVGVNCQLDHQIAREPLDPHGSPYEQGDDAAIVMLTFANGAQGVIHATTLAYEDTPFGQTHHMEFHGSEGTLYHFIDWDRTQRVSGARQGDGQIKELAVPERIWGGVRRDSVHNTYKDIFRQEDLMTRQFITAIVEDHQLEPNFHDGAYIQRLIEAAVQSDCNRQMVKINSHASKLGGDKE
jgi:predicted dehydrogenase